MAPQNIDLRVFERDFKEALEEQRATGLSTLARLGEAQALLQAFLQHESRRVESKLGADHPRSRSLKVAVDDNFAQIEALSAELEISRIRVPAVDEGDALVHGRVRETGGRGLPGLTVCLVDRAHEALAAIDPATTDRSGYYSIAVRVGAGRDTNLARSSRIFLAVFTAGGKLLHRGKQALELAKGARLQIEVTLDRGVVFEPSEGDLQKAKKEREKPPVRQPPVRRTPPSPTASAPTRGMAEPAAADPAGSDPSSAAAGGVSVALDALEARDDFAAIGASRAKLEARLTEAEVGSERDLDRFIQQEERQVRDALRLPNLVGARVFMEAVKEILEEQR